jgi:TldD protein
VDELLQEALDAASAAGASYADSRAVETRTEAIAVRGPTVEAVDASDSAGFGVRVLVDGAWGYAASALLEVAEARAVALTAVQVARASASASRHPVELVPEPVHVDIWSTPVRRDPFSVALEDKLALLTGAAEAMERVTGVHVAHAGMDLLRSVTRLHTSEGTRLVQTIIHSGAGIEATAVDEHDTQTRTYPGARGGFASGGYEVIEDLDLLGAAERTAEEAVALLRAPECPDEIATLVLGGNQMMLQVHESVGHPTELDRVLGIEAAFAGKSFVTAADAGGLRYGSELINITADATTPGGLGTFGYDDEGVAAQSIDLVRAGVLVGFQTSRETAALVGAARSNGTMRAEGWENFPIIRMTNINLLPGEGTLEDLIADVDHGFYMETNRSWSIDDRRENFQFGCEVGYEIRNGRLARLVKNPRYTGNTPVFWKSCDALAGASEWRMWGTPNCGKGQPGQTMRVGHGTVPARFIGVQVGVGR